MPDISVGLGFDMHKLVKGRLLILGGVRIPFSKGLLGHSDGDCLTHAVIDALFGAANKGDIGSNFGVDKPEYKGVRSIELLKKAGRLLKGCGILNIDTVIICEEPRLSRHIPAMKRNIARALGIKEKQVSVKSTTAKGMGDIGKSRAIAAQAAALLKKK
jgi:2-C-methyl-D-erythritol 2,4-cyclodiphosphate synthase